MQKIKLVLLNCCNLVITLISVVAIIVSIRIKTSLCECIARIKYDAFACRGGKLCAYRVVNNFSC